MINKLIAFGVLVKLMCSLAYAFDKITFTHIPGHRTTSEAMDTLFVSNRIQCVRACKRSPMCTSANFLNDENTYECELNVDRHPTQQMSLKMKAAQFYVSYIYMFIVYFKLNYRNGTIDECRIYFDEKTILEP